MKSDILVARESFTVDLDGHPVSVVKGQTRARASHPIVRGREEQWEPVDLHVHYDVEQATASPGERRAAPAPATPSKRSPAAQA